MSSVNIFRKLQNFQISSIFAETISEIVTKKPKHHF